MSLAISLAEHGFLSDRAIRKGIRRLLGERLEAISKDARSSREWVAELEHRPVAEETDAANDQHYEIPAPYFETVLGPHLKYSCGYWPEGCETLEESEAAMLKLTCERADLAEGQDILELGCGWGSLSLWMAENYPGSRVTAISNSNSQRAFIESRCAERGITNLKVITCDINAFEPETSFDRVVSVEMFEHVRNHRALFQRISRWLKDDGKVFVHVFSHRDKTYLFEPKGPKDWMSRYFFTGGIMPAVDLLPEAANGFVEEERWPVNGVHYSKTLEAWLEKQDAHADDVLSVFGECYGTRRAKLWAQRWRIFYMACSELFAYNGGTEWPVTHYRFAKQGAANA